MAEIKPFTGVDDRVCLAEVIPLDTPFTLNIFPSNVCNFRCSYCAQSLGVEKLVQEYGLEQEKMSLDTIKKVAEQAKKFPHRLKLISMMGHGEPLCNSDLPEMIRLMKKANIADRIDIITNASLLTKEYSERLIDAGLDVLRVSLQGLSTEAYEKVCGVKLNYDTFIENLTYFYKHKKQCKVYVKTMDVSLKEGEEQKFYDLFSPISDRMYIDKVKPVYDGVDYSETAKDLTVDRYGNKHQKRVVCPQPFYMLSVWANGDVAPCDALYKANPLGNVHTSSLLEMWKSEELKKFCAFLLEGKKEEHEACRRCCAPDDVAHHSDILDFKREELKKIYKF